MVMASVSEPQQEPGRSEAVASNSGSNGEAPPKLDADRVIASEQEDFPDPEEDDLDDLDDMLDDFTTNTTTTTTTTVPAQASSSAPTSSGPGRPAIDEKEPLAGLSDNDFAKQLQSGMADFMKELETSPQMQTQFQTLLRELGGDAAAQVGAEAASSKIQDTGVPGSARGKEPAGKAAGQSVSGDAGFQETIKKTMDRMQASGDQANAAAASDKEEDFLAEMMRAMAAGGGGLPGDGGGEEDFSKVILGMMEQLTNKEILYEPMKELHDKFPAWMDKNAGETKPEDLSRYKEQQVYVREIVERFEKPSYKDDNASDREFIVDRMQKMQAAGSPPADLVGDMAAAQEAFGAPEDGCAQQ